MRTKILYHALGMDKALYSKAPEIKHAEKKQREHIYVRICGKPQEEAMLKFMKLNSITYEYNVPDKVKNIHGCVLRVNIIKRHECRLEAFLIASSQEIAEVNSQEVLTMSEFFDEIL